MKQRWYALFLLLILLPGAVWLALLSAPPASAQMQPTPPSDRLAPWPTVYPPTQADSGAQEYYQRCMVCHGDRGQGLTAEWRGALDPADQNCWQSGCHHQRTLPGGFIFPKAVPPVIGSGVLARFETAQDLNDYIKNAMPYQAPNSLSDEVYWQLTAYLMRANGFYSGSPQLNEAIAGSIRLEAPRAAGNDDLGGFQQVWWLFVPAGLLLAGGLLLALAKLRRRV